MKDFEILIVGSDANAYYMARCAYEAYHKKAHIIAKDRLAFTKFSNILTIEYYNDLWDEEKFVAILNSYAKQKKCPVLVISTNETYSMFLAHNKSVLDKNLVFPNQDEKVLLSLTNKEKFYKTYKNKGLSFPETYYFDPLKSTIIPTMNYPVIVKPSDVVEYNHLSFVGKEKIYQVFSEEELNIVLKRIKDAHYTKPLIIQEFIEGDDSYLFDSVVYVGRDGLVKTISFAQIGLQERTRSMIGNAATLINGFNTFNGDTTKMKESIKSFMEKLGMNGFFEVDMKYDRKSNTFKVLEINARQGRSSYYITPLGVNLVKTLVDDLILAKELSFKELNDKVLLSFVTKRIIKKYCLNEGFVKEAMRLWHDKVSPMECPLDKNFKRFLMMKKRLWHYNKEYKESFWQE